MEHKRVIGLKRNQLYTPTVHQLSPHHRVKISFSSSLKLGGGQAARIWKSGESKTERGIKRQYIGPQSHFSSGKVMLFEGSMFAGVVNGKVGQETNAWFIPTFPSRRNPGASLKVLKISFYFVEMQHSSKMLYNYITDTRR